MIRLYYKNLNENGGVPVEIRTFLDINPAVQALDVGLKGFLHAFGSKDAVVMVGFYDIRVLLVIAYRALFNYETIVWPLGQVSQYSIEHKLFARSPIIGKNFGKKNSFISGINVKSIYVRLFRFLAHRRINYWVFSEFERNCLTNFIKAENFETVYWPALDNLKRHDEIDLKSEHVLNARETSQTVFLCYSRVDVLTKGIDRFYKAVSRSKNCLGLVAGPYYAGNTVYLENSENFVMLMDAREYSRINLRDADWVVLLSRWDGFPRVLREALLLEKPILVSEETHFSEIIRIFGVGVVYDVDKDVDLEGLISGFDKLNADFTGAIQRINSKVVL